MDDTLVRPSEFKVENVFTLERLERSDLDSILTCQAKNSNVTTSSDCSTLTVLLLLGLTLHTTWRDMSEDLVTNNEVHTDLDPGESPDWSVEVSLVDKPECLLAKHLDKHLALCSDSRTVRMLIEELLEESEGDAGMGQVLDLLVLTSYSLADLSGLVRPGLCATVQSQEAGTWSVSGQIRDWSGSSC